MQSLLRDQDMLERGRFEEKIEMAEKLFARGMSIEDVSEITELTI